MIYIFDYDIDIAFALDKWLQLNKFKTKSFTSLSKLFQSLKTNHPDCILLDCGYGKQRLLPEICQVIRDLLNYKGSIIITSTTILLEKDLQLCNANGFITKPFDFDSMINVINEQMDDVDQLC